MSQNHNDENESKNNTPVNLEHIDIKDRCMKLSQKYLPKVEVALDWLLDNDPYKGILAWERITEFSVPKKNKEQQPLGSTNITINMVPATTEDSEYIDLSEQKKIGEDIDYEENND